MAVQVPGPYAYGIGPAASIVLPNGGRFMPPSSTFGLGADEGFSIQSFVDSARVRELSWRRSYFDCTQHDYKTYDFDGLTIMPGPGYLNARRTIQSPPPMHIPMTVRRPCAPVRLLRTIVSRFTALVFGKGRFPAITVVGDPKSQDFAGSLAKSEKMHSVMRKGRNIGGSVGTVGFSWRFFEGKPRLSAHSGSDLHVHEWLDREELIPAHVSEFSLFTKPEVDPKSRKMTDVAYWQRRDWTLDADVWFVPQRVTNKGEPIWEVDTERSFEHKDGFCHFVWTQNIPNSKSNDIDGDTDYSDTEEISDSHDIMNSVITRGGIKNLDPTLHLRMAMPQMFDRGVRKGSEHALVGDFDAKYLELAGSSIQAGLSLLLSQRKQILESAECVIPDPDELTAAGMSSVAIEMVYAPMLAKADTFREQYGQAIERLLEQQVASYRRRMPVTTKSDDGEIEVIEAEFEDVPLLDDAGQPVTDELGNPKTEARPVFPTLALPPRIIEEEVLDADGNPTGETTTREEPREPGDGGDVELNWPPYFPPSDADNQQKATSLTMANGGKPLMSHKSSVEQFVAGTNLDPQEEWQRISDQKRAEQGQHDGMFPPMGEGVPGEPIDVPLDEESKEEAKPEIVLTPSAQAGMITVDEARRSANLKPHADPEIGNMNFAQYMNQLDKVAPTDAGPPADIESVMFVNEMRARAVPPLPALPEPEGSMTVVEWKAYRAARGTAAGTVVGQVVGQVEAEAIEPSLPTPAASPAVPPTGGVPIPAQPPKAPADGQGGAPPEGAGGLP